MNPLVRSRWFRCPSVRKQRGLRDHLLGCLGEHLGVASSTLTMTIIRTRASLGFCQLMVADLRSLSVCSWTKARRTGWPSLR
mgnify:CR=1 FL=1